MKRVWKTPELDYYNLYADMLQQPHLLIAGATGSGKTPTPIRSRLLHDPGGMQAVQYTDVRNRNPGHNRILEETETPDSME